MKTRIGTCSLCGGDVMGFNGIWMATVPPPPAKCSKCGATEAADVIRMHKPGSQVVTSVKDKTTFEGKE